MLDLYGEEEQRERAYGPVPAGSKVMIRMTVETPTYSAPNDPFVSRSKGGLLGLWVKFEVASGQYEGVAWRENIWLPVKSQRIQLDAGQTTACNMGGRVLKAIVQASRCINPKDESEKARRAHVMHSYQDFTGMEFPARLGIAREPYTGKDGKTYWNNMVSVVITPDKAEYDEVRNGQEIITDGAVTGGSDSGSGQNRKSQSSGNEPPAGDDPPTSAYDDVPF